MRKPAGHLFRAVLVAPIVLAFAIAAYPSARVQQDGGKKSAETEPVSNRYVRNVGGFLFGTNGDIPVVKRPTYAGYPY
jgi:hypothetical protein